MSAHQVISTTATLASADGARVARLVAGDPVTVLGRRGGRSEVHAAAGHGFVASRTLAPILPPEARATDLRTTGELVRGPGGLVFGKLFRLGLFHRGLTTLNAFFAADPDAFPDTAASRIRVMRAVSENEGRIEALNTWDNAFLSVGVYQWTVGAGADAGELAALLAVLKRRSLLAFEDFFGRHGLDVALAPLTPGAVPRGVLTLDGRRMDTPAEKETFRAPLWAYRFWRAAHDREVRRAQVDHAMGRISVFHRQPVAGLGGRAVSDLVTSEYGIALILDQHVNRPAHLPSTLGEAAAPLLARPGKADPARWTTADESALIAGYLAARARTSMTDSQARAERIGAFVRAGKLSDKRGSFR